MLFWNHRHTPFPLPLPFCLHQSLICFSPSSLPLPPTSHSFPSLPLFLCHQPLPPFPHSSASTLVMARAGVLILVESGWVGLAIAVGSGGVLPVMSSSGSVWAGPSLDTARAQPDSTPPLIRRSLHSSLFLSAADGNVNKKQSPLQTKRFSPSFLTFPPGKKVEGEERGGGGRRDTPTNQPRLTDNRFLKWLLMLYCCPHRR